MDSNIGLSREYPCEYFPPDTLLYQLAVDGHNGGGSSSESSSSSSSGVSLGRIPPLFGTVPAETAIKEFMDKEMGIGDKDVSGKVITKPCGEIQMGILYSVTKPQREILMGILYFYSNCLDVKLWKEVIFNDWVSCAF